MSIQYIDLVNAINRVNGSRKGIDVYPLEEQLSQSLAVYKERGEFDGTVDSAKQCLERAGYEFETKVETIAESLKDCSNETLLRSYLATHTLQLLAMDNDTNGHVAFYAERLEAYHAEILARLNKRCVINDGDIS